MKSEFREWFVAVKVVSLIFLWMAFCFIMVAVSIPVLLWIQKTMCLWMNV